MMMMMRKFVSAWNLDFTVWSSAPLHTPSVNISIFICGITPNHEAVLSPSDYVVLSSTDYKCFLQTILSNESCLRDSRFSETHQIQEFIHSVMSTMPLHEIRLLEAQRPCNVNKIFYAGSVCVESHWAIHFIYMYILTWVVKGHDAAMPQLLAQDCTGCHTLKRLSKIYTFSTMLQCWS